MKRLTFKTHDGGMFVKESDVKTYEVEDEIMHTGNAIRKLSEYEDLEEQGRSLKLPCKLRDIVYDVVFCDDGKYHVFEMRVCNINPFGDVRKGKVWNIYLEDDYTKAYRSFYDFGNTVFFTQEEAEEALQKMKETEVG